jgi:O-methyltransferase
VTALCKQLDLGLVQILEGVFPEDTAGQIDDQHVCFCHIDVDVYQSAKDVFDWTWRRMPPGGVVVFDDYGFATCGGVTQFVNDFVGSNDRIVVHNLNGHAVVAKLSS